MGVMAPLMAGLALISGFAVPQGQQSMTIGKIDFFGQTGLDEKMLAAALTIHEGQQISYESWPSERDKLSAAIEKATGKPATDIPAVTISGDPRVLVFIGVQGPTVTTVRYKPRPSGTAKLPDAMLQLGRQFMEKLVEGIQKGKGREDDSKGYAISDYLPLREIQLKMREFALGNDALVMKVLASSKDDEQRQVSAQLLGYAKRSPAQIRALVDAMTDSNGGVRNNAVRALGVIVGADPKAGRDIPVEKVIPMVKSGIWTDRNKGGMLLAAMTASRDPKLLARIRNEAVPSLIEMAKWKSSGHASTARRILGRVAGLSDQEIAKVVASGDLTPIFVGLGIK